ncbi:MAG: hypothetical protein P4L73_10025 [Caulobacteraceae bacterium]|nr:hypothetical protein [Caulobacteraceae bacterium]
MTLSQFEALIARFGPVVDNWPADEVEAALDLLQASERAQDIFAGASAGPIGPPRRECGATDAVAQRAMH